MIEEEEEKDLNEKNQEESRLTKKSEDVHRSEADELKKEINEWERNKVRVQEKIEKIEKRTVPLFENLGDLADQSRLEQNSLLLNYSQIDRTKKRISDIEQQLKDLE
jgi:chromosome segregation ATPase